MWRRRRTEQIWRGLLLEGDEAGAAGRNSTFCKCDRTNMAVVLLLRKSQHRQPSPHPLRYPKSTEHREINSGMSYAAVPECFFRLSSAVCVSLSLDICWDVSLFLSEECCDAACAEAQWHDQTNSMRFLMNADKATDETDGVWLYSAVMSLMNRLIIPVMMFHHTFFC